MGKSSTEEARLTAEILNNPKFQKMARQKSLLGWSFSAVMFSVYTAFIWIIGTRPDLLGRKVYHLGHLRWHRRYCIFLPYYTGVCVVGQRLFRKNHAGGGTGSSGGCILY